MHNPLKVLVAFLLVAGFFLASHDAFSRAVPAYEATERTVLDTRPTSDLLLAAKQKYPRLKGAATLRIKPVRSDA